MSSRDDGYLAGYNALNGAVPAALTNRVLDAAHAAGAIVWADDADKQTLQVLHDAGAEVVRLRAALEQIAERAKSDYPNSGACHTLAEIARGALRGDDA